MLKFDVEGVSIKVGKIPGSDQGWEYTVTSTTKGIQSLCHGSFESSDAAFVAAVAYVFRSAKQYSQIYRARADQLDEIKKWMLKMGASEVSLFSRKREIEEEKAG